MKRKTILSVVLSTTMVFGAAIPAFASSSSSFEPQSTVKTASNENERQPTNVVATGNVVKFDSKLVAETNLLNSYVSKGEDGLLHIDPAGKDVVSAESYAIVENGIGILNSSLSQGTSIIENNLVVANPNVIIAAKGFSNTYWWGVALTMNKADTEYLAYNLSQLSTGYAAEAAVATLLTAMFPNPATFAAAAAGAIVSGGCKLVSDSLRYWNTGAYGTTLNVHWLPVPYYEVTQNSSFQY
ncbi:hypothetical protein ACFQ88_05170 [Paenibacillus sp. NPDC056579]|uniref:hypothetical protein n=1 Tax=Paenibacillus sp. NPDC056579 TaxID=3345871 RepID=UPI0036B471EF